MTKGVAPIKPRERCAQRNSRRKSRDTRQQSRETAVPAQRSPAMLSRPTPSTYQHSDASEREKARVSAAPWTTGEPRAGACWPRLRSRRDGTGGESGGRPKSARIDGWLAGSASFRAGSSTPDPTELDRVKRINLRSKGNMHIRFRIASFETLFSGLVRMR